MCGFAGIYKYTVLTEDDIRCVTEMSHAIRHRGPDDDGIFTADNVAFGFRRLSIIDLAGGAQPYTEKNGRYSVVYNGEIYNYLELKEEKSKLDSDKKRIDDEMKRISVLIMDEMGAFCESELSLPGRKFLVTFKPQKSERILAKELEKLAIHHKDVYDEYVTKSESRKFSVKELRTA